MAFRKTKSLKELKLAANEMRKNIIEMLEQAKSGHTAGSLGMADIFAALYLSIANHEPRNPNWDGRDRIILSNGHICPVLYAALAQCGYFETKMLKSLRKLGSPLQGHPHIGALPGIENSSGPLGQGLSQACGMALANRMDGKNNLIFCLTSDGEHQEGQTWEAAMFASKYKLGKLIQIMDRNMIQIDGNTERIMPLEPLDEKYLAFGWKVYEVDGNNMGDVMSILQEVAQNAREGGESEAPILIIANTIPSKGLSFAEGSYKWHGKAPNKDEAKAALAELEDARKIILKGD